MQLKTAKLQLTLSFAPNSTFHFPLLSAHITQILSRSLLLLSPFLSRIPHRRLHNACYILPLYLHSFDKNHSKNDQKRFDSRR